MKRELCMLSAAMAVVLTRSALAAPVTVATVQAYAPNPNALGLVDSAGNTASRGITLAAFQTLVGAAFTGNTGGTMDFQEAYQGGSWPNQNNATNGVTVGAGTANKILATYGAAQTTTMSFFRLDAAGEGIDANVNQGNNVISGGYKSPTVGGTGNVDFTTTPPPRTLAQPAPAAVTWASPAARPLTSSLTTASPPSASSPSPAVPPVTPSSSPL